MLALANQPEVMCVANNSCKGLSHISLQRGRSERGKTILSTDVQIYIYVTFAIDFFLCSSSLLLSFGLPFLCGVDVRLRIYIQLYFVMLAKPKARETIKYVTQKPLTMFTCDSYKQIAFYIMVVFCFHHLCACVYGIYVCKRCVHVQQHLGT